MLISPGRACNQQTSDLEPFTRQHIVLIAGFMRVDLHCANAITLIARHLHQRQAVFTRDGKPLNDYKTILDAVAIRDPLAKKSATQ